MLIDNADGSLQVVIVNVLLSVTGWRFAVGYRLIDTNSFRIGNLLCKKRRHVLLRSGQLLMYRHLLMIIVAATPSIFIFFSRLLKDRGIGGYISIIVDGWRNAAQLQSNTG